MLHPQLMWWVSRATGMVGGLLLVGSLVWGVLLATRVLKPVDRPAWLLGLHRWMSSLACIMIAIHMAALVADNYVYFGWRELFVPWGSEWKNTAVALGVIAMWLLVLVQGTSLIMKRLPKRLWHAIHVTSYAAVWLGFVHGALAGTDVTNPVYQYIVMLLILSAMGFALVRVLVGSNRARARENAAARHTAGGGESGSDSPRATASGERPARNPRIPESVRAAQAAAAQAAAAPAVAAPAVAEPQPHAPPPRAGDGGHAPPRTTPVEASDSRPTTMEITETPEERIARLEALAAQRARRQSND